MLGPRQSFPFSFFCFLQHPGGLLHVLFFLSAVLGRRRQTIVCRRFARFFLPSFFFFLSRSLARSRLFYAFIDIKDSRRETAQVDERLVLLCFSLFPRRTHAFQEAFLSPSRRDRNEDGGRDSQAPSLLFSRLALRSGIFLFFSRGDSHGEGERRSSSTRRSRSSFFL